MTERALSCNTSFVPQEYGCVRRVPEDEALKRARHSFEGWVYLTSDSFAFAGAPVFLRPPSTLVIVSPNMSCSNSARGIFSVLATSARLIPSSCSAPKTHGRMCDVSLGASRGSCLRYPRLAISMHSVPYCQSLLIPTLYSRRFNAATETVQIA